MQHLAIAGELEQLVERITAIEPGDLLGRDRPMSATWIGGYATGRAEAAMLVSDRAAELRSQP